MCGRTACTNPRNSIRRACAYRNSHGNVEKPRWRQVKGGKTAAYETSYNVCPGNTTPVMVSANSFKDKQDEEVETVTEETEFVLQPMRWGLIPSWYNGPPEKFSFSTINCRADSINSKNMFKTPLSKGRRCVVVVDGFFEWKKDAAGKKQPYFVHFPWNDTDTGNDSEKQPQDPCVADDVVDNDDDDGNGDKGKEKDWNGKRLLTMAGVFDVNKTDSGKPLYSYSVITVDASKPMSAIHTRMPAILEGEDEIRQWLDSGNTPLEKAIELLSPKSGVEMFPVSTIVNNVRNKSDECVKPIDLGKKPVKNTLMTSWLKNAQKHKTDEPDPSEPEVKKPKP
ncbi:abasic site processing protein HMCES-like [Tubulanus polymorphus]|uniref:abasic site processing protein HMCES-like n=1 Tax=Tubulanus polymorphus TaxID=672921 RepID=UPI003DA41569